MNLEWKVKFGGEIRGGKKMVGECFGWWKVER